MNPLWRDVSNIREFVLDGLPNVGLVSCSFIAVEHAASLLLNRHMPDTIGDRVFLGFTECTTRP